VQMSLGHDETVGYIHFSGRSYHRDTFSIFEISSRNPDRRICS
jgi:hypothetical protein